MDPIGAGSMGFVFSAYDPGLDRKVAIKLLRTDSTTTSPEEGARLLAESTLDSRTWDFNQATSADMDEPLFDLRQQRLLREAQAMARFSHPNVVAVYEVGTFGRDVFIAMQYIEGKTLREWLAETSPSWKQILEVYRQAGKGLVEAHRQGLIHRDFKPDNVMIDGSGRVYILDFGLVHSAEAVARKDMQEAIRNYQKAITLKTETKAVLGTPAYMSPEQLHGKNVDERSDQFSFCVSLYEALYKKRPFSGSSIEELGQAMERGVGPAPNDGRFPSWVFSLLARGLQADPNKRWPSMESLLSALAKDPSVRRKSLFKAATAVIFVGLLITIAVHFSKGDRQPVCSLAMDPLQGSWGADMHTQAGEAFSSTEKPYAKTTWKYVESKIDKYAQDWIHARYDACEAAYIKRTQSEYLFDLRMACLDQGLAALRTLGKRLVMADSETIEESAKLVDRLPELSVCSNTKDLLAPTPLPPEKEYREEIQHAREKLASFTVSVRRGEYDKVLRQLEAMEKRARETGYQPILAEILLAKARLLFELRDLGKSEQACWDALVASLAGNHSYLTSLALIEMVRIEGSIYGKQKAFAYSSLAKARIDGTHADESLDLLRIKYLGDALLFSLAPDEALRVIELSKGRFKQYYGKGSFEYTDLLALRAQALFYMDRLDESLDSYNEVISILRKRLGDKHPHLIMQLCEVCTLKIRNADPRGALKDIQLANDAMKSLKSASIEMKTRIKTCEGEALSFLGKSDEALMVLDKARALSESKGGSRWLRGYVYARLTEHYFWRDNFKEALVYGTRSLREYERSLGDKSIELFVPSHLVGAIEYELGRYKEAEKYFRRVTSLIGAHSVDAPPIAHGLTGLGESLLAQGKTKEAIEILERAYRIRAKAPGYYWSRPRTAYALAHALANAKIDHARSLRLARQALEEFSRVCLDFPLDRRLKKRMFDLLAMLEE